MSILTRSHMLAHELERLIEIEIERLKDNLAMGFIENIGEYKHATGKIAGLRAAIDFLAEANAICEGKPREH